MIKLAKKESLDNDRKILYEELKSKIGNTNLYEISKIPIPNGNRIFAKEEYTNPTGTMFDRIYPLLFQYAEESGIVVPGITPVIESSTGNAGAAFAWTARELGIEDYTVIIPEESPKSRVEQIKALGGKIIFSPYETGAIGHVITLEQLLKEDKEKKGGRIGENPNRLYCMTKITPYAKKGYSKLVNEVVINDALQVDLFVGAVASGTSISGIGHYLKQHNHDCRIIAYDPEDWPSISHLKKHGVALSSSEVYHYNPDGIFVSPPLSLDKMNIDIDLIDDVEVIQKKSWKKVKKELYENENKRVGSSSIGALTAALQVAEKVYEKNILICFYDEEWKYSNELPNEYRTGIKS